MSAGQPRPLRVALLIGDGPPPTSRSEPWDLALDLGATRETPDSLRRVGWRELLSPEEAEGILARCRELVTGWHAGLASRPPLALSPGRVVETAVLLEAARSLKYVAVLNRLASREGPLEVHAARDFAKAPGLQAALECLDPPVRLVPRAGPLAGLHRAALRLRARLSSREGTPARGHAGPATRPERTIRVWGLANYRNRVLLERLRSDARFSLRVFERSSENRYLPERLPAAPDVLDAALRWVEGSRPALDRRVSELFPEIPGVPLLLREVVEGAVRAVVPAAEAETRGWQSLLAGDPPDVIVCGIPWGGDLRTLALATASSGPPVVAVQDGALSEVGAGGIPVGAGALAWGPLGRLWFERRGFEPGSIHLVGDPYLERLVREVEGTDQAPVRARLGMPKDARVLLASVQNTAPHVLAADPADPVRDVRLLLAAVARAPGWCLVLKPHPRLPIVDGRRRLALLEELAGAVPSARLAEPEEPIAGLMALADAHVGEGDTLTLEMLACDKPALLVRREGVVPIYPEYSGAGPLPVAGSAEELAALLARGVMRPEESARRRLLELHLRAETPPAEAILHVSRARATL